MDYKLHGLGHLTNPFPTDTEDWQAELLEWAHVTVDGLLYIGKEANNIDEQPLDVKRPQVFVDKEEVKERILKMTYKEGEALGINRGTLWRMKNIRYMRSV